MKNRNLVFLTWQHCSGPPEVNSVPKVDIAISTGYETLNKFASFFVTDV